MNNPSLNALEKARAITLRWAEPGGLDSEHAQRELAALFEQWKPIQANDKTEHAAEQALCALERAFNDWLQRGENCEELLHQLLWILDPAHNGVRRTRAPGAPWPTEATAGVE